MKIVLIGHGAMGQLVAAEARKAGDDVGTVIASKDNARDIERLSEKLRGHDGAIDFSVAAAVLKTIEACPRGGGPVVEGTTGWNQEPPGARRSMEGQGVHLAYGRNIPAGANCR